jgi:pectate lyase
LGTGSLSAFSAAYRTATQLQLLSPLAGTVNFYQSGKIISGCRNVSVTAGGTAICSWKPSQHGYLAVSTAFTLKGRTGTLASSSASYFVPKRTGNR